MDYNKYKCYIEERWDNMIIMLETKKLNDYALGRAMIKFSSSDNSINKLLQKRGIKQAIKYQKKRDDKLKFGLERISEYIAVLIINNVEGCGGDIIDGEITPNSSGTAINIVAKYTKCDSTKLNESINNYLETCVDKHQIISYDVKIDSNDVKINISLSKSEL